MKYSSFNLSRAANIGLRITVAVFGVLLFGLPGLLLAALNPNGLSPILGASYTRINAQTKSDVLAMGQNGSSLAEQLWVMGTINDGPDLFQINPFSDNMSESAKMVGGQLRGGMLGKAVVNVKDTTTVQGNTINIPTRAGLAGPGVQGEGDRIGSEQKLREGIFPLQIGRQWFGAGTTTVAQDETIIGSYWDQAVQSDLRQQVAKKKSDDILMKIIQRAGTSGRNYLLPGTVASRQALTDNDLFNTSLITKINGKLQGIGAMPMAMAKDSGGSAASKYVVLGTADGLRPLDSDSAYLQALQYADDRGDANHLFAGGFTYWRGVGIYAWEQINHANYGPVGSPLLPRAYAGGALDVSGTTTNLIVLGGGSAAAAAVTPAPQYFAFFSNAPYTFTNGQTIAAVTNVDRWIRATNPDGSKLILKYRINDGNKITLPASALITGVSGFSATAIVEGALIEECANPTTGTIFVRHIGLGARAIVTGAGSIQGTNGGMGRRTEEKRNHGLEYAVGIEYAWGCEAWQRPDLVYPGFVLSESAMPSAA